MVVAWREGSEVVARDFLCARKLCVGEKMIDSLARIHTFRDVKGGDAPMAKKKAAAKKKTTKKK